MSDIAKLTNDYALLHTRLHAMCRVAAGVSRTARRASKYQALILTSALEDLVKELDESVKYINDRKSS